MKLNRKYAIYKKFFAQKNGEFFYHTDFLKMRKIKIDTKI